MKCDLLITFAGGTFIGIEFDNAQWAVNAAVGLWRSADVEKLSIVDLAGNILWERVR